jgi:hypothetical protein
MTRGCFERTDETRIKTSNSLKGRVRSEEHCRNISESKKHFTSMITEKYEGKCYYESKKLYEV